MYYILLVALLYHIFVPQISLLEIDFWKWELNIEEMKARHDTKIYPPRIKMEVSIANTTPSMLKLCFHGCKSKIGKDITVERILPKGLCMCVDVHVLPACLTIILYRACSIIIMIIITMNFIVVRPVNDGSEETLVSCFQT